MLIVVEGPDGAGKTTLIQQMMMSRELPYFVTLTGARPSRASIHEMQIELNWLTSHHPGQRILCDRNRVISESIYGPAYERARTWSFESVTQYVDETIDVLIYCRPQSHFILENVRNTSQMGGVIERIERLIDDYDRLMGMIAKRIDATRLITYDYQDRQSFPALIDILKGIFNCA